jgi:hypothetical protein
MTSDPQLAIDTDSTGETVIADAPPSADERERSEQAQLFAPVQTLPGQMALDLARPS